MANYYGVDVSSWNDKPDWSKAKGIHFCIIRITERYGIDTSFEHNYKGCTAAGIKVGGYKFSYAASGAESRVEAEGVLAALKGRKLDYPVFLDLEWEEQESFSKGLLEEIIEEFAKPILAAGYQFGIYTNEYWHNNILPDSAKSKYEFWIAKVPTEDRDNGTVQERLRPKLGVGWQYSWNGRVDGIGGKFDMDLFYKDYAAKAAPQNKPAVKEEPATKGVTAEDVLSLARSCIGRNEADGSHKMIIDTYNRHLPLARGYAVQYDDAWCDTFISFLFIKLNAVYLIGGAECGVEEHIKLFKNAGIWNEDGNAIPKPGWLICYNWDKGSQPNDGYADHIGIVESCNGNTITLIEGNYNDAVKRRTINVGWGYIRGYAMPKYAGVSSVVKPSETASASTGGKLSKEPKWVGVVNTGALNVRSWAGKEHPNIKSWPVLKEGNLVDVCDTVKDSNGKPWYYVRIQGKIFGFCAAEFIKKA